MNHYYPSSESAGERVFLITYADVYGGKHLQARVVRTAVPARYNDEGHCVAYEDGKNAVGYRNATWLSQKKNALLVEDLYVHCYVDEDKKPFGVRTVFKDTHIIETAQAVAMANTLTKLDKGLAKEAETNGYVGSNDFAGNLIRVAKLLGIKKFLTYRRDTCGLDTSEYFEHGAQYLADVVANIIEKGPQR